MNVSTKLALAVLIVPCSLAGTSQAATLYSENFDSLTEGDFSGGDASSGVMLIEGQIAASDVFSAAGTEITLEADVTWQSDGTPNFFIGLNEGGLANPVSQFGGGHATGGVTQWRFRDASLASTFSTTDYPASAGVDRTDRFRLVYDFTAGTVAVSMDDGADGSGYISLGSYAMNFGGSISDVDSVYLRGGGGSAGFDNIVVTGVPEPGSLALLGLGGLALLRRRR